MTSRATSPVEDPTVVVPENLQGVIERAAKGSKQRAILEAIAAGEAIRIEDYSSKQWAYSTFRSFQNAVARLREQGVVIAEGPFGPRGGKRWRFHPEATQALRTTNVDHLEDFATHSDPVVRAATAENPSIPESVQTLLAVDSDQEVLRALAGSPHVAGPVLHELVKNGNSVGFEAGSALLSNPATPTETILEVYASEDRGAGLLQVIDALEGRDDRMALVATKLLEDRARQGGHSDRLDVRRSLVETIYTLVELPAAGPELDASMVSKVERIDEASYIELGDRAEALAIGEAWGDPSFVAQGARFAKQEALKREGDRLTLSREAAEPDPSFESEIGKAVDGLQSRPKAEAGNETWKDVRERRLDALNTLIEEFRNSDDYLAALQFRRDFGGYSVSNTHLLLIQCEKRGLDPSLVMGAKSGSVRPGWKHYGRYIKKNQKALWILAPLRIRIDEDEAEYAGQTHKVVGFKPAPVFAYEQTDGEPLPPGLVPSYLGQEAATEESVRDWRSALEETIRARGFTVEYGDSGRADGYTRYDTKQVVIDESLAPADQVNTLAHELGHVVFDHGGEDRRSIHRGTAEVEAESFAYLMCRDAGLDTSEFAMEYITGWDDISPVELGKSGDRVIKTVEELTAEGPIAELIAERVAHPEQEVEPEPAPAIEVPSLDL